MAGGEHTTPGRSLHTRPQHVWVCVTGAWGDQRCPGVLLEWRRTADHRWEALVVWVLGGGSHAWDLRHGWVRGEHVRPRTGDSP